MSGKKTIKGGKVYEDGVCRGPTGGSGFVYTNQKYWVLAALAIAALILT